MKSKLLQTKPDIAVITLFSNFEKIYPFIETCVSKGINVVTSAEDLMSPWLINKDLADKLNDIAIKNNVSVVGSGAQDGVGYPLLGAASLSVTNLKEINGSFFFNTEDLGKEASIPFGVGLILDEYNVQFPSSTGGNGSPTSPVYGFLLGLIEYMGWKFKSVSERVEPVIAKEDVYSPAFGRIIPKGDVIGTKSSLIIETEDEQHAQIDSIVQSFGDDKDAKDKQVWQLIGDNIINIELNDFQSMPVTVSGIINRIFSVVKAAPGLHTLDKL